MRDTLRSPYMRGLDVGRAWRATTLRQLEEATICRLHGYKDGVEYYTLNSPKPVLDRISVPTLVIHAEDDPVVSVSTLPLEALRSNPRIFVAITRRGGHIGWGGGGAVAGAWTDSMAARFIRASAARSR